MFCGSHHRIVDCGLTTVIPQFGNKLLRVLLILYVEEVHVREIDQASNIYPSRYHFFQKLTHDISLLFASLRPQGISLLAIYQCIEKVLTSKGSKRCDSRGLMVDFHLQIRVP